MDAIHLTPQSSIRQSPSEATVKSGTKPTAPPGSGAKPILLRTEEAANLCNTPPKTWRMWNKLGKVPTPLKIGKLHFWRYDELVSWVDAGCPVRKAWNFQRETKSSKLKS